MRASQPRSLSPYGGYDTESVHFKFRLGESFEFAGQTWRLDEIDDESHRWYATLTRVA